MPALPPPVSALERRLGADEGSLDGPDLARALAALEDASALALAEVPAPVADRWAVAAPAVVSTVVMKAARREYENPQGYETQGVGEVSASVAVASGAYLTAFERELVRRAGGRHGFTGSVRTPSAYS